MKKSLASGVGVAAALLVMFGSGTATGKPVDWLNGKAYAEAEETVTWTTLKILAREGSYLPTAECVIFGAQTAASGGAITVNLNCNARSALGDGHPGGSVATPEGRSFQKEIQMAKSLSDNYASAVAAGKSPRCSDEDAIAYCTRICTETKACSAELEQALGV